jgi:hypothetical protein
VTDLKGQLAEQRKIPIISLLGATEGSSSHFGAALGELNAVEHKIGRASGATAHGNIPRDFTADREIASAARNRIFTSIWNSPGGTWLIFWASNRGRINWDFRGLRNPRIGI